MRWLDGKHREPVAWQEAASLGDTATTLADQQVQVFM